MACTGRTKLWAKDPASSLPPIYSIVADDDGLYGTSSPGVFQEIVWGLPHGQPEPKVLARTSDGTFRNLVPYGSDLYFSSADRVMRVPKVGGTLEQVAEHACGCLHRDVLFDMVRDETDLYVSIQDTRRPLAGGEPNLRPGELLRMRLPGGPLVQFAVHDYERPRLAVDDAQLYISTDDGIAAIDKGGGKLRALVATSDVNGAPSKLATSGGFLYALAQGQLMEINQRTGEVAILYRASILLDVAVHGGWIYVVRGTAFQGAGRSPEPGGLLAVSQVNHTVRTIAEPLDMPQRVVISGQKVFVLEDANSMQTGLAQIKQFNALT